ncbi:MAG: hypothetical protein ABIC04_05950 [Nanoarchaeota archaeon]
MPTRNHGVFRYNPDFTLEDIAFSGLKGVKESIDFIHDGKKAIGLLTDLEFCILTEDGYELRFNPTKGIGGVSEIDPKYHIDANKNIRLFFGIGEKIYSFDPNTDQVIEKNVGFPVIPNHVGSGIQRVYELDGTYYLIISQDHNEDRLFEFCDELIQRETFEYHPKICFASDNLFFMSRTLDQSSIKLYDAARKRTIRQQVEKFSRDFNIYPLWNKDVLIAQTHSSFPMSQSLPVLVYNSDLDVVEKLPAKIIPREITRFHLFDNLMGLVDFNNDITVISQSLEKVATMKGVDNTYGKAIYERDEDWDPTQYVEKIFTLERKMEKKYIVGTCAQDFYLFSEGFELQEEHYYWKEYYKDTTHTDRNSLTSRLHQVSLLGQNYLVITAPGHCEILSENLLLIEKFSDSGPDVISLNDHLAIGMRSDEVKIYNADIQFTATLSEIAKKRTGDVREIVSFHKV